MLFNFQSFIEEMRENPEKKEVVDKYEALYGPIQGDVEDQLRYTDYLSKFPYIPYSTPDELGDDFDWPLLERLITGSFSSDYELKVDTETQKNELYIAVNSGNQSIVKTISELWSFQMLRLYEIYIEEQMNIQVLRQADASEEGEQDSAQAIDSEREMRLKKWDAVIDTMGREQLAKETKAEQEEKLGDLLGKL